MRTFIIGVSAAIFALGATADPAEKPVKSETLQSAPQTVGELLQDLGYENATPRLAQLVQADASAPKPLARSCAGYTPPANCTVLFNNGNYCIERCTLPTGGTIDGFCDCGGI